MKKIITLCAVFIFCMHGFAQVTFQKCHGDTLQDYAYCVRQISSGGYIATGDLMYSGLDEDVYLARFDSTGDAMWIVTFSSAMNAGIEGGRAVEQTAEGGFIVCGTGGFGVGGNMYLIKTDYGGNITWAKSYGRDWFDYALSVKQITGGGYIVAGYTDNSVSWNSDAYLVRTDSNGNMLWRKSYGGTSGSDQAWCVWQTAGGEFMVGGRSSSYSNCGSGLFMKLDANGNVLWCKIYYPIGGIGSDELEVLSFHPTNDGGYVLGGTYWQGSIGYRVILIKTDDSGNIQWSKSYHGTTLGQWAECVQQTTDGGFIIAGSCPSAGFSDVYLVKTDSSGDVQWSKAYGGADIDEGFSVYQTHDKGYVVGGYTRSFGQNPYFGDIYIIKTDSLGKSCGNDTSVTTLVSPLAIQVLTPAIQVSSSGVQVNAPTTVRYGTHIDPICYNYINGMKETSSENNISIVPNPVTSEFRIQNSELKIEYIEIYDVLGQSVFSQKLRADSQQLTIDVSMLNSGIYFVKGKGEKEERVAKFVKE